MQFLSAVSNPFGMAVLAGLVIVVWSVLGGANIVSVKQLRENRGAALRPLATEMRAITDKVVAEKRKISEEEQKRFDDLDAKAKEICVDFDAQITRAETLEAYEGRLVGPGAATDRETRDHVANQGVVTQPPNASNASEQRSRQAVTEERFALAFQGWMRCNSTRRLDPTDEQRAACQELRINPQAGEFVIRPLDTRDFRRAQSQFRRGAGHLDNEQRALSTLATASGAALIPPGALQTLEVNMLAYGGVLQAAETIRTERGEPFPWPTADDTSNSGRQIGESQAITATAEPAFAQKIWSAYQFTSDEVLVPFALLEDSAFDLQSIIFGMLGERLGRILNTKFTTGTGAGTPFGIVPASAAGITTASSTAIAWDEITQLIHSIDPAYRATGCGFMMHDNIVLALRQLKDGIGRPLWQAGPNDTPPPSLQGFPYFINQDMASSIATTAVTMLFGQLSKYKVRQVREIRMYRLIERHRENDQDAFLAFIRADGNLLNAGTAPVKKLTQV